MTTSRTIRPYVIGSPVSRTMFAIIRVLIGSYFLAVGTGLILEPSSRSLFDGVLPTEAAALATTAYLFITAFMIMVGRVVRPAALLLAIYIFWSAFVHYELGASAEALTSFWRDMALLGAVLLVAVTEPGGSQSFHLWRKGKGISPRRIIKPSVVTPAERAARPARELAAKPRETNHASARHADEAFSDADDSNIFADIWDTPLVDAMAHR